MQSTGHTSTQAVSLVPMQGSAMMWAMGGDGKTGADRAQKPLRREAETVAASARMVTRLLAGWRSRRRSAKTLGTGGGRSRTGVCLFDNPCDPVVKPR
jgi:hypothetical protein